MQIPGTKVAFELRVIKKLYKTYLLLKNMRILFAGIIVLMFVALLSTQSTFAQRGPKQSLSFRGGFSANEDIYYVGGDFSFPVSRRLGISTVLSFYFTPEEHKVLRLDDRDVYLNLSETKLIGSISIEKVFWLNNTLGFYASAGAGWAFFEYAGSNRDDDSPVVPLINSGIDINFSGNIESENSYGMRLGYQFINFKSETNHLGFISFVFRF